MATSFLTPTELEWGKLKSAYLLRDRIPKEIIDFLDATAISLADQNVFEPDRSREEKRKGAIILIRDIITIHNDLIFAIDPKQKN